ncbi:DUF1566 domain-containing protein [uncultured Formosa sp.]|uniref:Lcl domain-containing protein n=1 Tax=uncultured Formosa sp. TaxID=255435 RepID=UPI0026235C0F|nr:DUF1566 domain-containing protein [uncultured Formosa sp.]
MKRYLVLILICLSTPIFAQQNSEHLMATIIGSGSPKFNTERSGPSVLISYKNTNILVDMGNGTQANLNANQTKIKDLDALLFTHHHLDHNEEFTPIFIQSLLGGNTISISGPAPTTTMVDNILTTYKDDINYRLSKSGRDLNSAIKHVSTKNLKGDESFFIGDIKITCTPVNHTITTLAYRFDVNGESIVISGDLTYSESLPVLAKNVDYLIMDSGGSIQLGAKARPNRNQNNRKTTQHAHVNLAESSQMAQEAHAKILVLTHFNYTDIDEAATKTEIRKNYNGTILFGFDLMKIPLIDTPISQNKTSTQYTYPIVDTNVKTFYSDVSTISKPSISDAFYGQDANYLGHAPTYIDNNDSTITDQVTGLMWEKDMGEKLTYNDALVKAKNSTLGDYKDWRIPTIKELYSLILFSGQVKGEKAISSFIDTNYFNQPLGNINAGEREIDAQTWSSTQYVGKTMNNNETVFGVNFIDGRIKGYPKLQPKTKQENKMYFRMVRGNTQYGKNNFIDNRDGTVSDLSTGLMWQKSDSKQGKDWKSALLYAENLTLATHTDWRLPNAKELQSIVDYTRSPQTTHSPAIDSIFDTSEIKDANAHSGQYPYFWTSTTHLDGKNPNANAVYIAFGEAQGKMRNKVMDVHGAGAQRSDPKSGNKDDFPQYFGPQGDIRMVYNYVRAVRDITPSATTLNTEIPQINNTQTRQVNNNRNNLNTPPSFSQLLEKMDTNKDQKISKSEAIGQLKNNFEKRDRNNDGYLTEDEMKKKSR